MVFLNEEPKKIVVIPVEWGYLGRNTVLWYLKNIHFMDNAVHIIHVPDFRRHLHPKITPEEVMEIMIETNTESEQLKKLYECMIEDEQVTGKFVRVGGNNRWSAIVEYCKRVDAVLLVIGSQPKPERLAQPRARAHSDQTQSSELDNCAAKPRTSEDMSAQDLGPFVATVTHDVVEHCGCPFIVYREPEKKSRVFELRNSDLVRGSFKIRRSQEKSFYYDIENPSLWTSLP